MNYCGLWLALMLCVITTPLIAQDAANQNDFAVAPDEGAVRGEVPRGYVRNAYAHMMSVPQPYPTEAHLMRQEGSPVVQTVVYGDGRLQYALAESSGSPLLDKGVNPTVVSPAAI